MHPPHTQEERLRTLSCRHPNLHPKYRSTPKFPRLVPLPRPPILLPGNVSPLNVLPHRTNKLAGPPVSVAHTPLSTRLPTINGDLPSKERDTKSFVLPKETHTFFFFFLPAATGFALLLLAFEDSTTAVVLRTRSLLAHLPLVVSHPMTLAHVIWSLRRKLLRRHANHTTIRSGVHHSAETPQVLIQKHPTPTAWLADPKGVERKPNVDQIISILVLLSPMLSSNSYPCLEHDKQRPQGIDLGMYARCGAAAQTVEPPSDHFPPPHYQREMIVTCAAPADLILSGIVFHLFHPALIPPVGELWPGPHRTAWGCPQHPGTRRASEVRSLNGGSVRIPSLQ